MRITLKQLFVVVLADIFTWFTLVTPSQAFISTTGYVRTASQSAVNAALVAQRSLMVGSAAGAMTGATAASVAVRLATGPLGWGLLGVSAGIALGQLVYNQSQVGAIKAAAATPGTITIPGSSVTVLSQGQCGPGGGSSCVVSPYDAVIAVAGCSQSPGTGWQFYTATGTSPNLVCYYRHLIGNDSTLPVTGPSTPATQQQLADYLNALPASDPLSPASNSSSVGQSAPATADNQITQSVASTDVATSVQPASSVQPTDVVLNPNAVPPAGTTTTTQATQAETSTSTKTSTTTTNPDGSTTTTSTETESDTATASCSAGTHDQRSFGTVLTEHMAVWQSSGLLSALNSLKTLVWPTTMPTYSLQSSLLGNFSFNFDAWSGVLTGLRTIMIALASFVAYRIVFVGSK